MRHPFDHIDDESAVPFTATSITHLMVEIFLFMHPAILPLLMRDFEINIVEAGLVLAIPNFIQLGLNIPSGALADKIDSRYLLFLCAVLSGFGAVIVSQSPNVIYLVVGLSILMIAVSMYHPPGLSIVSKLFSKGKLTTMVGMHGATGCIGQGLGTISMSLLIGSYGWRSCYLLWAIFLFVWSIILTRLPFHKFKSENRHSTERFYETKEEAQSATGWKQSILQMITGRNFLLLILAMSIVAFGNHIVFSFTTTYFVQTRNVPEDAAALIFGIGPVIGVFGSLIGGYLGSGLGDRKYLSLAFFGLAVFAFSLGYAPWIGFMVLSFLIYRWFSASIWPASISLVSSSTPESDRGTAYSLFMFVPGIFGAVSPIIGALIIETLGILSVFPFVLILFLLSSFTISLVKD